MSVTFLTNIDREELEQEINELSGQNVVLTDRVEKLEKNGINNNFTVLSDSWKGKKWYVLGDSISVSDDLSFGNTAKLYHEFIKDELSFSEIVNLAASGTSMGNNSTHPNLNINNQLSKVGDDADLITIFAGVNDRWFNVPLGNEDDTDVTTFYGAMNTLCQTLHENHSQALVVFITPLEQNNIYCNGSNTTGITCREFANAMIEICEKYSFDYYDANRKSGIYPYITENGNMYTTDGLHLNYKGHRRLANNLSAFLFGKGNNRYSTDTDEQVTLSSISVVYTGGNVVVGTSVNDLTDIVVTAHYSDGTSQTLTNYILSGTITEGNNTVTVSYGGKYATFTVIGYVEETEITLTSISATYTGGKVIRGTSVNDLTGITVTAHYSDGSTANITDYTLSGEILKGDNIITVNYQDKTTTFTVVGIVERPQVPDKTIEVIQKVFPDQFHVTFYVDKEELPSINNANPVWGFDITPLSDFTVEAKADTGGYYLLSKINDFMAGYELIGNQYITPDIVNNGDGSYTVTLSSTGNATKEADKPYWCFPANLNLKAGDKFILSNYYVEVDGVNYNICDIAGAFKDETLTIIS